MFPMTAKFVESGGCREHRVRSLHEIWQSRTAGTSLHHPPRELPWSSTLVVLRSRSHMEPPATAWKQLLASRPVMRVARLRTSLSIGGLLRAPTPSPQGTPATLRKAPRSTEIAGIGLRCANLFSFARSIGARRYPGRDGLPVVAS